MKKKIKALLMVAAIALLAGTAAFAATRYRCSSCNGRGRVTCSYCGGSGRNRAGGSSWENQTGNCGRCKGAGQVTCGSCSGYGYIYR